jgi:hypothetical protein
MWKLLLVLHAGFLGGIGFIFNEYRLCAIHLSTTEWHKGCYARGSASTCLGSPRIDPKASRGSGGWAGRPRPPGWQESGQALAGCPAPPSIQPYNLTGSALNLTGSAGY